jgi:hypothetical protein
MNARRMSTSEHQENEEQHEQSEQLGFDRRSPPCATSQPWGYAPSMSMGGGGAHGGHRSWPSGHVGWVFSGVSRFESRATTFLAEGAARGERQMFVVDNPVVEQWPMELVDGGELVIASVADIYGPDRMVAASSQRETFAGALADALSEGYTGIRVAADNSSLIDTPERLQAWLEWEEVADRFIAENPITGLCAFDRTRVDSATLSAVTAAHRVSVPD